MLQQATMLAPLETSRHDDPRVVHEQSREDYSLHAAPLTSRVPKKSLTMSWYALVSGMFYLVTAAVLAAVVGTVDTIIGIVLACVAFGVLGTIFSRYAAKTGLTVSLISQRLFGATGSLLAPIILAATAIFYAVFESSMIAHAFQASFGWFDIRIWYAIAVAMNLPLVMGGVRRWMDKYNAILLPVYGLGLLAVVVISAMNADHSGWISQGANPEAAVAAPGWLYAFFVYLGVLVLMMFTVDYGRLSRPEDAQRNGITIFGPVFYVFVYLANGLLGIFIAYAAGFDAAVSSTAIAEYFVGLLGGWGLLLVWVTQARINSANFYVASTNLEAVWVRLFRRKLSRVVAVLITGAITYLLMLTDLINSLLIALSWQGAFISAWVGVLLVHIIRFPHGDNRGMPEFRIGRMSAFTLGAGAWLGAALAGALFFQFGGAIGGAWSTPATLMFAAVLYAVATNVSPESGFLRRRSNLWDEVDDLWEVRVRCHRCDRSYVALEMDRDPSAEGSPAICIACATTSPAYRAACRAEHGAIVAGN